jgi:hypothetical protein
MSKMGAVVTDRPSSARTCVDPLTHNMNRTQWSWPLVENIFMLLLPIHEIIILKKSCSNVITQENMTSVLITMNKTF